MPNPKDEKATCGSCGGEGTQYPHGCPYKQCVQDDYETECSCCKECEHEGCVMGI